VSSNDRAARMIFNAFVGFITLSPIVD